MVGLLREGLWVKAGPQRKNNFNEAQRKVRKKKMTTKLSGGTTKKNLFLRLPLVYIVEDCV